MKETSQLLRWGIPGTVFFGTFFFFIGVDAYYANTAYHTDLHSLIKRIGLSPVFSGQSLVGVIAFLIAASIPVGFIISQLYYFGYWSWLPFRTRRRTEMILSTEETIAIDERYGIGALLERYESERRFDDLIVRFLVNGWNGLKWFALNYVQYLGELIRLHRLIVYLFSTSRVPIVWRRYRFLGHMEAKREHIRWVSVVSVCLRKIGEDASLRFNSLNDVYHGLGTTLTAVFTAWVLFTFLHNDAPILNSNNKWTAKSQETHSLRAKGSVQFEIPQHGVRMDSTRTLTEPLFGNFEMYMFQEDSVSSSQAGGGVTPATIVCDVPWIALWTVLGLLIIMWKCRGDVVRHQLTQLNFILRTPSAEK